MIPKTYDLIKSLYTLPYIKEVETKETMLLPYLKVTIYFNNNWDVTFNAYEGDKTMFNITSISPESQIDFEYESNDDLIDKLYLLEVIENLGLIDNNLRAYNIP